MAQARKAIAELSALLIEAEEREKRYDKTHSAGNQLTWPPEVIRSRPKRWNRLR